MFLFEVYYNFYFIFLGLVTLGKDKNQKEKENKGLFSKFRKSKKKSEQVNIKLSVFSVILQNFSSLEAYL